MNALEKLKLAREASAQRALAEQATGMEKLKAARAFKAALAKLGITAGKPAAEPTQPAKPVTPAEPAGVELPELVRKLRDGELSTASAQVMSSAIMEAEPYLSVNVCSDRVAEWLEKNPELVRN